MKEEEEKTIITTTIVPWLDLASGGTWQYIEEPRMAYRQAIGDDSGSNRGVFGDGDDKRCGGRWH
jgi:hypothetical protein